MYNKIVVFVFFFQAEDGIRDFHVTGVQTCALPISEVAGNQWDSGISGLGRSLKMPGYKNSPGFSFNRRLSTSVGPSAQAQISTVVPSAREATSTYDIGGWRLDREASFQGRVLG